MACPREVSQEERAEMTKMFRHILEATLNSAASLMVTDAITMHVRDCHKYDAKETLKLIVELQATAHRNIADRLEERVGDLLARL